MEGLGTFAEPIPSVRFSMSLGLLPVFKYSIASNAFCISDINSSVKEEPNKLPKFSKSGCAFSNNLLISSIFFSLKSLSASRYNSLSDNFLS